MGHLLSRLAEIDKLRFYPFPTRPIIISKIVRISSLVLSVNHKTGRLYTTSIVKGKYSFCSDVWPWLDELLSALVKLDVIPQSVADEHKAVVEKQERKSDARSCLKYYVPDLEKHGVKLTATQRRILEKAAGA